MTLLSAALFETTMGSDPIKNGLRLYEKRLAMENLKALIVPKAGNKINQFDKHSKYIVKIHAAIKLENSLFEYAENFYKAAHIIAEFILYKEIRDTWKRDSYFFAIAFLYRHCME